jgi:hypothetical protein
VSALATVAYVDAGDANALKYSAQSLTTAQQLQARQNIYAAPFDAMAYSGMQINGGMEVSQELGVAGTNTSGAYPCDGWKPLINGTMTFGSGTSTGIPIAPGFRNTLYFQTLTAQPSLSAANYAFLQHSIEGYRISRLAWGTASAQPITIAFWSNHYRAGLWSGTIRNNANNRYYAFTYTQAASGGSQYNVITIPGDTTGTWTADNSAGIVIAFAVASGTTQTAPTANTWAAGSYIAAPGQVNGVTTTSDVFRITGVIVLPGTQAPTATQSPYIMRPYGEELLTCKRYYEGGLEPYFYMQIAGIVAAYGELYFQVSKRAAPTGTISGWQYYSGGVATAVTPTFVANTEKAMFNATGLTSWQGWCGTGSWKVDARL